MVLLVLTGRGIVMSLISETDILGDLKYQNVMDSFEQLRIITSVFATLSSLLAGRILVVGRLMVGVLGGMVVEQRCPH